MSLLADVGVRVGPLDLQLRLEVQPGATLAILGPNGAGKTTLLRCVAGLTSLDAGRIELGGRVLDDPAEGAWVAPADRSVGVVFQDLLLFPHLSVLDNVAFGLRARGADRVESRSRAASWLERMGLADRAGERPRVLSGGERQRVALARALATDPELLLLDEPLSALDASTRGEMRSYLRAHLACFGGSRVLVTHDPVDAMVLADQLLIVEGGRVRQQGTPGEVASRPRTRYVAELVGQNLLRGSAAGDRSVRLDAGGELHLAKQASGSVLVAVRPQAVALHPQRPEGDTRNAWRATVAYLEGDRDRVRVRLAGPVPLVAEVTTAVIAELQLAPGSEVWASVSAVELDAYPA